MRINIIQEDLFYKFREMTNWLLFMLVKDGSVWEAAFQLYLVFTMADGIVDVGRFVIYARLK